MRRREKLTPVERARIDLIKIAYGNVAFFQRVDEVADKAGIPTWALMVQWSDNVVKAVRGEIAVPLPDSKTVLP